MLRIITLLACLISPAAFAEGLTFVSVASMPDAKRGDYEAFLKGVTPIWNRHGMTVVLRTSAFESVDDDTFDEIALLRVESREGFQAYLADPAYRAIAQDRLEAVDSLFILEGPLKTLPRAQPAGTDMSLILLDRCDDETPAAHVNLVGPVKGTPHPIYKDVGCVRFVTADDIPFGGNMLGGFSVTAVD